MIVTDHFQKKKKKKKEFIIEQTSFLENLHVIVLRKYKRPSSTRHVKITLYFLPLQHYKKSHRNPLLLLQSIMMIICVHSGRKYEIRK